MKKFLLTLIVVIACLSLVFAVTACGNTDEPVEKSSLEAADDAEVISNPTVSLGENLPTIELPGDYIMGDPPRELAEEGIYAIYIPKSEDGYALALYRFAKNVMTMQELIDYDIEKFVLDDQPVNSDEFYEWDEPDDYHYGYYAYYDGESFEKPCFMQDYIFESGDDYVYAEFVTYAKEIPVGVGNAYIEVPANMVESEISEADAKLGCVKLFEDPEKDIPNVGIYVWDTEATTGEELLKENSDDSDGVYNIIDSNTYSFEAEDGNTYESCRVEFTETIDGVEYREYSTITIVGDKAVCINVTAPADDYEYAWIICPTLLWTFDVAAE